MGNDIEDHVEVKQVVMRQFLFHESLRKFVKLDKDIRDVYWTLFSLGAISLGAISLGAISEEPLSVTLTKIVYTHTQLHERVVLPTDILESMNRLRMVDLLTIWRENTDGERTFLLTLHSLNYKRQPR